MKKINILALSAAVAVGTFVVSCQGGGGVSSNVSLKNDIDTLSYAYGVNLVETGLGQALQQMGIVQDTSMFKMSIQQQISMETDSLKKKELTNGMTARLDSLKKANRRNIDMFMKGVSESLNTSGKDKDPYYNGVAIGSQLKQMTEGFEANVMDSGQHVNKAALLAAINSSLKFEKNLVPNASAVVQEKAMAKREADMKKQEESMKSQYADKIASESKFLEENKSKDGIVTLPSGLQYKVVKAGNGAKPGATDRVNVTYKGTLIDGTEFDSGTTSFGVNQVIKGWTEALQLMPEGSKWTLYIPYDLGYGAQATGAITPFSTLIFDVELHKIEK